MIVLLYRILSETNVVEGIVLPSFGSNRLHSPRQNAPSDKDSGEVDPEKDYCGGKQASSLARLRV